MRRSVGNDSSRAQRWIFGLCARTPIVERKGIDGLLQKTVRGVRKMRLQVEQGSQEWLDLRKEKVTATDCAPILGVSKYSNSYDLWMQKMNLMPTVIETEAMRRGKRLEAQALAKLNEKRGLQLKPAVILNDKHDWQMGSFDGISDDGRFMGEIKCGKATYEEAKQGIIAPDYIAQMQHLMCLSPVDYMLFFSYDELTDDGIVFEIEKDKSMCNELMEKEYLFHQSMLNFEPPSLTEKDYIIRDDAHFKFLAETYRFYKEQMKVASESMDKWEAMLLKEADEKNTKGWGVRLTKCIRKGAVDYKAVPELKGVNLEIYRKSPTTYWRIGLDA